MKTQYNSDNLIIFESELFRTTTSLLIGNDYLLLIDPNWLPREIEFIHQYIESIGGDRKRYLLFTHSDYDHIIGYGKFKTFKTIASENFILNKEKAAILEQINDFDDQYYIKRNYPIEYPEIDIVIKDDNVNLQLGSDDYIFHQGVGHNKDGLVIYNKSKRILIVGDYLSNIEFPYVYESFEKYKSTLKTLEEMIEVDMVGVLVTGHGDSTKDKKEMLVRVEDSKTYIQDLKKSILKVQAFDLEKLFKKYHFPKIMMKFHNGNIKLLKKEISESKS